MTSERSFFARFFLGVWRLIDGARKLVLNLVFLLILFIVVSALVDTDETLVVEPDTALVLRPYGDIVEQYSGTPLDYVLMQATETGRTETRLRDLVDAIRADTGDILPVPVIARDVVIDQVLLKKRRPVTPVQA